MTTNADITIFNGRYQKDTRTEAYVPTTIRNVSLLVSDGVNTNDGVWTDQATYKIRIPFIGAEVQDGREYEFEELYRASDDPDAWTIRKGDYIVTGLYDGDKTLLTKAELDAWAKSKGLKLVSITEYADNTIRGCDATKHWRIGGA